MTNQDREMSVVGRPAKAVPRVTGEVYGKLINLSGRRRFTSQRVVLYAVLAAQGQEGALQASKEALASFVEAHTTLVDGNAECPGVFCDDLHRAYFGPTGGDAEIRAFVRLAERAHAAIGARRPGGPPAPGAAADTLLEQLVARATPLLTALNAITQVYEDLANRQAGQARKQLLGLMGDIQTIAKQARIVSFNAQIVASRAHVSGREFSVVATELSAITSRIDELVCEAVRTSV